LAKEGDTVVFTSGLPFNKRRKTNDLRIEEI
jgi:pyruvate kinase